jgi:hypothetical protein
MQVGKADWHLRPRKKKMALLASALLTIAMTYPYPGPWIPWSSMNPLGGSVTPASHDVVEHTYFSNTVTATDTDEWRRATGPGTYETRIVASTAHRAVVHLIRSAAWIGPLALTSFDGQTGTAVYHQLLRAKDTGPHAYVVVHDFCRVEDGAAPPHLDGFLLLSVRVKIRAPGPVPIPPEDPLPPGPGGGPAGGGR